MSYCTVGNIKAYYLNKSFASGDYCSENNVQQFIDDDEAIINAALSVRYSLPITDVDDLKILRSINSKMVVGTIDDIFREKTTDDQFERSRNMRKEAVALLDKIKTGEVRLTTAGRASTIKFNSTRSDGEEVSKRFLDSNIDEG